VRSLPKFLFLSGIIALGVKQAYALPLDLGGVFGVDTHQLSNVCRTTDTVTKANPKTGTQGIDTNDCGAGFQTYILKLNPNIIVNDGVTLKGEISSGYIRGGYLGDNSANNSDGSGNNSYFFSTPAQRSGLNVNQMYMEIYAETALVKIGRMSKNYGMGMVFNDGSQTWDRFVTIYDGVQAEMKIGNFSVTPHYAKISSYNGSQAAPAGNYDVRELGLIAKYDNPDRDLIVSLLYAKRSSERRNSFYNSNTDAATIDRGATSVTVIEPYASYKWKKLTVEAEGTIQSGNYGTVYTAADGASKIATKAFIIKGNYELNPNWDTNFMLGQVDGDKGQTSKFEASYLHPNFQVADLMFRYYYPGFTEGSRSIFDSSITNTRFYRLGANYKSDKWTWKGALIMAKAMETAQAGSRAYHHEEGYSFNATNKQSNNLGYEIDFGFDYKWNPNVTISGYYGYWKVGDYYAFTNTNKELSLANVHGGGLRATLEF